MSGTSLDGLDLCLAEISFDNQELKSKVLHFESISYTKEFKKYLGSLAYTNTAEICRANFKIAREWSDIIQNYLIKNSIDRDIIDLIGSHGQTIWHEHGQSTLQIGESAVLSHDLAIPCVADFRVMDVAAGGSGAPLVPFVDYLWFKNINRSTLLLNIGGIANFTIIPKNCISQNEIQALDTGPGNGLVDAAIQIATDNKLAYDKDGIWAKKGTINPKWLNKLLQHPYIIKPLPKSTGKEVFGKDYVRQIISEYNIQNQKGFENLVATLTRFTAESVFSAYQRFYSDKYPIDQILVSGGGANNPQIMKHLMELFHKSEFVKSEDFGIDPEAKEAHAFAILAAMRIWEVPSNVPKVTGAKKQVLLGKITF